MILNNPVLVSNQNWRKLIPSTEMHFNACFEDAMSFPQIDGIVESEKYVSIVNCICCKSSDSRQIFVKWGFIYSECLICKHIYVKNQLKPEILFNFYETSIADNLALERQSNSHLKSYWSKVYEKYLMGLLDHKTQGIGNLLDVGCGLGNFLEFAKQKTRLNLFGSEFSEASFAKLSKLLGGNLFHKLQLRDIVQKTNKEFDLISFWGVLEHMTEPLENLVFAGKLLKPQGRIIALVPNFHSRAMQILGINTPTLNPREHIQFFSEASMTKCAEKASLKIEQRYQELPIIDLMYPFIQYSERLISNIMERQEAYYDVYIFRHA